MSLPRRDGLNIVPFIDIMLVLLAIVLSISTFIAQGKIKVDLPKAQNGVASTNGNEKITIWVDENSQVFINDKLANKEDIENYVKNVSPTDFIVLKSDKNSRFEIFVAIIDALKTAKHENFAIVTEMD